MIMVEVMMFRDLNLVLGGTQKDASSSGSQKLHLGNHALSQRIRTYLAL